MNQHTRGGSVPLPNRLSTQNSKEKSGVSPATGFTGLNKSVTRRGLPELPSMPKLPRLKTKCDSFAQLAKCRVCCQLQACPTSGQESQVRSRDSVRLIRSARSKMEPESIIVIW